MTVFKKYFVVLSALLLSACEPEPVMSYEDFLANYPEAKKFEIDATPEAKIESVSRKETITYTEDREEIKNIETKYVEEDKGETKEVDIKQVEVKKLPEPKPDYAGFHFEGLVFPHNSRLDPESTKIYNKESKTLWFGHIRAYSPFNLKDAFAFYVNAMPRNGWAMKTYMLDKTKGNLVFEKENRLVQINLESGGDKSSYLNIIVSILKE